LEHPPTPEHKQRKGNPFRSQRHSPEDCRHDQGDVDWLGACQRELISVAKHHTASLLDARADLLG
jgi:hypothetical protein